MNQRTFSFSSRQLSRFSAIARDTTDTNLPTIRSQNPYNITLLKVSLYIRHTNRQQTDCLWFCQRLISTLTYSQITFSKTLGMRNPFFNG